MKKYISVLCLLLAVGLLAGCAAKDPAAVAVRIGDTVYTNEQVDIYYTIDRAYYEAEKAQELAEGNPYNTPARSRNDVLEALITLEVCGKEARRLGLTVDKEQAREEVKGLYTLGQSTEEGTPARVFYDTYHAYLEQHGITEAIYTEYELPYTEKGTALTALWEYNARQNGFDVTTAEGTENMNKIILALREQADITYGP